LNYTVLNEKLELLYIGGILLHGKKWKSGIIINRGSLLLWNFTIGGRNVETCGNERKRGKSTGAAYMGRVCTMHAKLMQGR
jgi:hypothetical protein